MLRREGRERVLVVDRTFIWREPFVNPDHSPSRSYVPRNQTSLVAFFEWLGEYGAPLNNVLPIDYDLTNPFDSTVTGDDNKHYSPKLTRSIGSGGTNLRIVFHWIFHIHESHQLTS